MNLIKLNCTSCGAPISIPDHLDSINCVSCGSFLTIERGEGYVALKMAEKLARAIEDSGKGTQSAIHENTYVTRSELQRLQLTQEVSAARMHLSGIQAEIRAILRETTPRAVEQLNLLRYTEYQAMERVRLLEGQLTKPTPAHLADVVRWHEEQLKWIALELQVLSATHQPQRHEARSNLIEQQNKLTIELSLARMKYLKSLLKSFSLPVENPANQASVEMVLKVLHADLETLDQQPDSAEANVLRREVSDRYSELRKQWTELEKQRVLGLLSSPNQQVDHHHADALRSYLTCINMDLQTLDAQGSTDVVREYKRHLTGLRRDVAHEIERLEKQARKAAEQAERAAHPRPPGLFTAVALSLGAFLTGLAVLVKELFTGFSPPAPVGSPAVAPAEPAPVETPQAAAVPAPAEVTEASGAPQEASGEQVRPAGGLRSAAQVGGSCLLSLITLVGISALGLVLIFTSFPTLPAGSPQAERSTLMEVGVFFLFITTGFVVGALQFLKRTAPPAVLTGQNGRAWLKVGSVRHKSALRSPGAVKSLVGLAVWATVYLVTITLCLFSDAAGVPITTWLLLLGLILGPAAGVLAFTSTHLHQGPAA